tara:strand:- start:659 stop:1033 length:375 start_codon:yes stop_codon:yes gene_type:complete
VALGARDIRNHSILSGNGACVRPDGADLPRPDIVEVNAKRQREKISKPSAFTSRERYSMTAEQFKAERQRLGLTIKAMAQRIGVSEQAIWYYESGKRKVPEPVALLLESKRVYDKLVAEKGSET